MRLVFEAISAADGNFQAVAETEMSHNHIESKGLLRHMLLASHTRPVLNTAGCSEGKRGVNLTPQSSHEGAVSKGRSVVSHSAGYFSPECILVYFLCEGSE